MTYTVTLVALALIGGVVMIVRWSLAFARDAEERQDLRDDRLDPPAVDLEERVRIATTNAPFTREQAKRAARTALAAARRSQEESDRWKLEGKDEIWHVPLKTAEKARAQAVKIITEYSLEELLDEEVENARRKVER